MKNVIMGGEQLWFQWTLYIFLGVCQYVNNETGWRYEEEKLKLP